MLMVFLVILLVSRRLGIINCSWSEGMYVWYLSKVTLQIRCCLSLFILLSPSPPLLSIEMTSTTLKSGNFARNKVNETEMTSRSVTQSAKGRPARCLGLGIGCAVSGTWYLEREMISPFAGRILLVKNNLKIRDVCLK